MNKELVNAMAELDRTKVLNIVREELSIGTDPLRIIDWLSEGVKIVGEYFEKKKYFLAELITSGDIFENAFQELKPIIDKNDLVLKSKGKIVIGTVQGDVHDIGKNIVKTILKASGFSVEDLGVDVQPEKFIEAVKQPEIKILGLSALLTIAIDSVQNIITLLERENLRNKVRIIIGGSAFTEDIANKLGVDAFGKDPLEAVKICQKFLR
ncbi:MAG: cobalamin B12-binding domain-containing protein [Promethearchaeota archaeon]|jgi:methylmalonyl-CoA mutase cobalamin-binding domain/chain